MTGEVEPMNRSLSFSSIQTPLYGRSLLVALACLLLAACGGGSGSGSSVTMSVSPQTVSVSATTTQPGPSPSFQVNVAGLNINQEVYVGAQFSGQGINQVFNNGGTLPATIGVQLDLPSSLGPGTYDGTVTVSVCFDQACSQPVGNSPQTVQVQYTVTKSTFAVNGLSPSSAYAGAQSFTLSVNGSTLTPQSTVLWNGNSQPTTFVNSSQVTAQISAADIVTAGNAAVSVSDPVNGTTNTETFTIKPSPLTLTVLTPATINVGSPAFTLMLTGSVFTSQSTVLWNGSPQPTTFVSATQLTAQIPASEITTTGSDTVSVSDPTYGTSNSLTFVVVPTPLALNSLSPSTVTVGGPSFMLTVLGTAFTGTSVVEWNGAALATTLISSTELIAQVPASNISATGMASVMVSDPNSPPGTTSAQTVTIAPPSIDAVAYQINPAHTGAVTFASLSSPFPTNPAWSVDVGGTPSYALIVDGEVIVTVKLSSGSSEMLALDQTTGNTVWGPVLVGGLANATYDNGRVFVVSANRLGTTTLEAYDANTGVLDWSTNLTAFALYTGAPTAEDGTVYVGSEGTMFALDESNGAVLWEKVMSDFGISTAVTMDGVYTSGPCPASDLRPATGEYIWQNNSGCGGLGGAIPVVANQLLYSPDGSSLYNGDIFNAETGASNGNYSADSPPAFTPTMGYFLQSGTLRGITLANNTIQWSFTGDGTLDGAPIVVNQYVIIGSSSGNLYALDGTTGAQVWNVNLGTAIGASVEALPYSGLAAGDGLLVVPSGTTVTAYTLSTNP